MFVYLNARVGDEEIYDVLGKFVVDLPEMIESGAMFIKIFKELGLLNGSTCFREKIIHKYTCKRVAHSTEVVDKAMVNYMVVLI